ncbi:MAG TPA: hypothetical protein VK550_20250 [Polyangiaceae bacterium]|nr:hypothetical protein [Polyangiaceae bacterium]
MTDDHNAHGKTDAGQLKERRFEAEPGARANFQALIGGLGVAALGAATYATWVHDVPMEVGPYLFGVGILGVITAALMGASDGLPIRVGDAGVAVERGESQPERIYWFEIDQIGLEGNDRIVVEGANKRIVAPLRHHAGAAGWILKEAMARIPKRVKVPPEQTPSILAGTDEHGKTLSVEKIQLAGRRCKASGAIISFERDARSCKRCGEVYEKKHVPEKCLTCEAPMATSGGAPATEIRE